MAVKYSVRVNWIHLVHVQDTESCSIKMESSVDYLCDYQLLNNCAPCSNINP
jgi:hypothetical protein